MSDKVFNWTNLAEYIPELSGAPTEPEVILQSPFGVYQRYNIDTHVLEGRFDYFDFARSMRVIVLDAEWHEERDLKILDGDWIRFNFSLSIDMAMAFSDGESVTIASPSWRVINNPPDSEVSERINAGAKTVWVTICCRPEMLTDITGAELENMPELLKLVASPTTRSFHEDFDFTERLGRITADVVRSTFPDPTKIAYVEARCIELLCLATNEIMNPRRTPAHIKLSRSDEVAIRKAQAILDRTFFDPPTVDQLGREVGVNRNKLYYGFRLLFDCGLSEYIQQKRLDEGRRLLKESDQPVSEIARAVGFTHQCNFSTAFKKRFGFSPSQARDG